MSQHDETKNDPTLTETTEITVEATEVEGAQSEATQSDETTTIEALLDESDTARSSTPHTSDSPDPAPVPASEPVSDRDFRPVDPSPAQPYASQYASTYAAPTTQTAVPEFKSGPAPTTSVFGLLGLLTAIAVLVSQATDLDIAWGVVGPVAVVGAGVLLVVLGLAGLRGQRFRG